MHLCSSLCIFECMSEYMYACLVVYVYFECMSEYMFVCLFVSVCECISECLLVSLSLEGKNGCMFVYVYVRLSVRSSFCLSISFTSKVCNTNCQNLTQLLIYSVVIVNARKPLKSNISSILDPMINLSCWKYMLG